MPPVPLVAARRGHLVVCGEDALACRVIEELTTRYGQAVTVLLRSQTQGYGPQIAALPGVRVIGRAELSADALGTARVQSAHALALLGQDDLGNFHAALRAQELNPGLRLVVRIFNTSLGERMRTFFHDCAVLSGSSMAAPSFVAAALGEPAPSHVRVAGRTLYVVRGGAVDRRHVICALAVTDDDPLSPALLPPDTGHADLVLAVADGAPRDPLTRQRRRPFRALAGMLRRLLWHRLGLAFLGLFALLAAGFTLLFALGGKSLGDSLYLTFMNAAGAALTETGNGTAVKVAQVLQTFAGLAFIPVATAAVVSVRLTGSLRDQNRPLSQHVIVAGLGNVGTRIVGQLHDLGVGVVCVDKSEASAGIPLARRLGLRVVIGETHREETLRAAGIDTCQALVSVTNSDIVNLETALHARALASGPRIVVRLGDDDLAERVQRSVGNTISRSVSYLAAPAFAAAMLEHQVLRTIPVGRHVLLIADIRVTAGSDLAGRPVEDVHQTGQVRVIALQRPGVDPVDWSPGKRRLLAPEDRIYVLATRAGLSRVLARSQPGQA
ncbi:MAG TPA: NAD-binding protein [Streptosporangiaceae bacterium]|nr:NAD-binding protein [Streptosporangiaceae bacterium]